MDSGALMAISSQRVSGYFTIEAEFSAGYRALYDQAGMKLRVHGENWLKTGIEFTDGALHLFVVVTRDDQSDWSVMPVAGFADAPLTLRLTRHAEA
jgi:regulation of enolase protein 1 (concanavalin A-like superfamily)